MGTTAQISQRIRAMWSALPSMSHVMRKPTLCHMRTTKAQISLRFSRSLISAFFVRCLAILPKSKRSLDSIASLCAGRFESYCLVVNPRKWRAPSEDSDQLGHPQSDRRDQLGHPHSLIYGPKLSSCGQWRLWSGWSDSSLAHVVLFVLSCCTQSASKRPYVV